MLKKKLLTVVFAALLVTACGQQEGSDNNSSPVAAGTFDSFAQCLADKGAVMYGSDTCRFCLEQKKKFRGSFDKVNYVRCDEAEGAAECEEKGITSTPTWIIDGKSHVGLQSLNSLSQHSGCEI